MSDKKIVIHSFCERRKCKKCSSKVVSAIYNGENDYLNCTCCMCNFKWIENPLDYKEKENEKKI